MSGLFSSFFGKHGLDKVCKSSTTLKLFEGFDVQFWEAGPWAPPPTFKSSQLDVYIINIYGGENGARMGSCHHCRAEKGEPSGLVQVPRCRIFSSSEMCDKFGLKTKVISCPDTDYRSYFIYKSLNKLLLLQGKRRNWGGCCPLQF